MIIIERDNHRIVIRYRYNNLELQHYFDKFEFENIYYYKNCTEYSTTAKDEFVLGMGYTDEKIKLINLLKSSEYFEQVNNPTDSYFVFQLSTEAKLLMI